jgi:hypothetical protein
MAESLSLSTKVVASREHVSCELENEVVVLNLRNGEYYGLNLVGAKIWNLIQEASTIEAVRDAVLAEYPELEQDECTRDVLELVQQLVDSELAEVPVAATV